MEPFAAYGIGQTVTVGASTTSTNAPLPIRGGDVRVYNATDAIAFVEFAGSAAPVATSADIPIPPGGVEVFSIAGASHVAVILAAGTGNVYFTPGRGL
jgi:hypothetical protein